MTAEVPWWVELFREDYYRFEGRHTPEDRTRAQVDFVERALALSPGERVLDLCCGWGRHSVELATRGYRVTGLDLSESELALARRAAERAGVDIEWVHADMRDVPPGPFGGVINLWTSFGYFADEAENQRVLDGMGRALRPGGRFLLDHWNMFWAMAQPSEQRVKRYDDGALMLDSRELDLRTGRIQAEFIFVEQDGTRHRHPISVQGYTPWDLERMLRQAGLRVVEVWGGWDGQPLRHDSLRMIVLAERP
jgi:SAM-dependent methyltransferase